MHVLGSLTLALAGAVVSGGAGLEVVREIAVDLRPRDALRLRVAAGGTLLLADWDAGRVLAFSAQGTHLWEWRVPGSDDALRGFDLSPGGEVWVATASGAVHVLGSADGRTRRRLQLPDAGHALGDVVADGVGGFFALTAAPDLRLRHYGADARANRRLSAATDPAPGETPSRRRRAGWLGRGPDGSLYYRAGTALSFQVFAPDGRLLRSVTPREVPYVSSSADTAPGDLIGATDVLPDGRILCEIVHRSSFEESTPSGDGRRVLHTRVEPRLYVIALDGTVQRSLAPATAQVGLFGAVGPRARLYFVKPGQLLAAGSATSVYELALPE